MRQLTYNTQYTRLHTPVRYVSVKGLPSQWFRLLLQSLVAHLVRLPWPIPYISSVNRNEVLWVFYLGISTGMCVLNI